LIPKRAFPAAPANQIPAKILSFVQWFEATFGADSGAPSGAGADSAKAIRDKIHDNFSGPTKPVEIAGDAFTSSGKPMRRASRLHNLPGRFRAVSADF
jgi:hypothetical protein